MISTRWKNILHWIGSILSSIGVIFVVIKLFEYGGKIDFSVLNFRNLLILLSLVMVYVVACIFSVLAWKSILQHFGVNVNFRWAMKTYGISQLAKYVPGNIFHLAGRQAIGQAAGLPMWPLAKSIAWELGLCSVTAAIFGFLVLPRFFSMVSVPWAAIIFACVLGMSMVSIKKFVSLPIARAMGYQALSLAISSLIFIRVLAIFLVNGSISLMQVIMVCGFFVVAWLFGLIALGAPAGLGVREFVLTVLLKGILPEADLLLSVILGRMITVGGDLVFFGIATLMNGGKPLAVMH